MRLLGPLTDGEIDDCAERWAQFATTEEDWKVARAFTELKRIRERQMEAQARQHQMDLMAQRAACDEDYDGYGQFVGVCG